MKKHHLIFISIVGISLIWASNIITLVDSGETTNKLIFGLCYLVTLSLLTGIITLNKQLSNKQKIGWLVFGLVLSPVLPLIYYFRYRDEIQRIIIETNKKMKEGPESLSEFDASSNS